MRIRRISAVMYRELESSKGLKVKASREMELGTDLLAGAGIAEPKIFKIKTAAVLKAFLLSCTLVNLFTMFAVGGRLKAFSLLKSLFTGFGFYCINKKESKMNLIFTGLFGTSVLMESVPCVAGIFLLFSVDVCSVLSGISSSSDSIKNQIENEEFLRFCRKNIDMVRSMGTAVIVTEFLLDTFMLVKMVEYQKYLKQIEKERMSLNYYTGKDRIEIP